MYSPAIERQQQKTTTSRNKFAGLGPVCAQRMDPRQCVCVHACGVGSRSPFRIGLSVGLRCISLTASFPEQPFSSPGGASCMKRVSACARMHAALVSTPPRPSHLIAYLRARSKQTGHLPLSFPYLQLDPTRLDYSTKFGGYAIAEPSPRNSASVLGRSLWFNWPLVPADPLRTHQLHPLSRG